jgi:hypothetical protein
MPYVKTDKEIKDYTSFLPKGTPRKIRLYHFIHKIDHIPKCEFTGENCYFAHRGYCGVNKFLFVELLQYDNQITVEPFKYLQLLRAGAPPEELIQIRNSRYFFKIREKFRQCSNVDDFFNRLLSFGFLESSARNVIGDLDFNQWDSIKRFVDRYYELTKNIKNNDVRFYEIRGFSAEESKQKVYDFANTWEKIKHRCSDTEWYESWCDSRRIGLESQGGRASFGEAALRDLLSIDFDVKTQTVIRLKNVDINFRNQIRNKQRFHADISFKDIIVEFNGSYWHCDYLKYPSQFSYDDYVKEIAKLKCMQIASKKRVFVVWEYDLHKTSYDEVVLNIKKFALESEKKFGSTREIDYRIYESLI